MPTFATRALRVLAWIALVASIATGVTWGTTWVMLLLIGQGAIVWAVLSAFADNVEAIRNIERHLLDRNS